MKTIQSAMVLGLVVLFSLGCKKEPINNLSEEESRIYITDHDSTINFSNFHTFNVSDSVAVIQNGGEFHRLNATDSAYVDAVKNLMQSMGYVYVAKDQNPDLGITVNRILSTSTGVISYGSYWDYYASYWDPFYWGFPGYGYGMPYGYAVYQITEGAVSVDMVDLKDAGNSGKLNIIWTGLIRGSGIYNPDVAQSQVKALFDQSSYLNKSL
ncbi:MAG: DUF4136 domain-containing protein [Chitinophagaceae bacterium]|nr:DUF4136 domain-containing protein [Chitinophagaceae bacterium]